MDAEKKLYADRTPWELEPYYCAHVSAMTSEGLHAKSAIAAELAFRDKRIAELEAALRAQAQAEPVRWERRLSRGSYTGAWEAISHDCERHDDRADGWVREYRPLYTAPPPDHAEALAEALQEIMSYEGGAESTLEDQYVVDRAQSALTRYKETRNG
jgi:hypothetical protein